MLTLTICADDFALNPAISQGIVGLLKLQRLSAVSCMTHSAFWPEHATLLYPFRNSIDIGLHFNLTEGKPLGSMPQLAPTGHFCSLSTLIRRCFLRQLPLHEIRMELMRQLSAFEQRMQQPPDFIDGHQHIHQLPGLREVVLTVYQEFFGQSTRKPYLRCTHSNWPTTCKQGIKPLVLACLGGAHWKKQLLKQQILHNGAFSGSYPFAGTPCYAQRFADFLQKMQANTLLMCHPAQVSTHSSANTDPIAAYRQNEFEYFSSPAFLQACQQTQTRIGRCLML